MPDSVTNIGEKAFYFCDMLTSITIPKKVATIDVTAFEACEALSEIYVDQLKKKCPFADTAPWGAPETCEVTYKPHLGPGIRLAIEMYGVQVEWDAIEDVDGYEVWRKDGDSKFELLGSTSEWSYINARNLAEGKKIYLQGSRILGRRWGERIYRLVK